jgi:hypothetical protein
MQLTRRAADRTRVPVNQLRRITGLAQLQFRVQRTGSVITPAVHRVAQLTQAHIGQAPPDQVRALVSDLA